MVAIAWEVIAPPDRRPARPSGTEPYNTQPYAKTGSDDSHSLYNTVAYDKRSRQRTRNPFSYGGLVSDEAFTDRERSSRS